MNLVHRHATQSCLVMRIIKCGLREVALNDASMALYTLDTPMVFTGYFFKK